MFRVSDNSVDLETQLRQERRDNESNFSVPAKDYDSP